MFKCEAHSVLCDGIVSRVGGGFGISPTITTLLVTTVLPLILNCFKKKENIEPEDVPARVVELHNKNSKALHRRLSKAYKEQALKKGKEESTATGKPFKKKFYELSDEAADRLATATIQECITANSAVVSSFASAC